MRGPVQPLRLAGAAAASPSPALRERVLAAVRATEQEPPPRAPVTRSAPSRTPTLLVAGGTDRRLDEEHAAAREMAHVLAVPDDRASGKVDAWGRGINVVTSESRRPAVQPRPLGLLDGETPVIATGLRGSTASLAVTTEPGGGSERTTSAPLVQLALESVGFGE